MSTSIEEAILAAMSKIMASANVATTTTTPPDNEGTYAKEFYGDSGADEVLVDRNSPDVVTSGKKVLLKEASTSQVAERATTKTPLGQKGAIARPGATNLFPMHDIVMQHGYVLKWTPQEGATLRKEGQIVHLRIDGKKPVLPANLGLPTALTTSTSTNEENGARPPTSKKNRHANRKELITTLISHFKEARGTEDQRRQAAHEAAAHVPLDPDCTPRALARQTRKAVPRQERRKPPP